MSEQTERKALLRSIAALAWPAMIEQALQTIVQYADSAMVGRLGVQATAAVGLTTTVTWLTNSPLWASTAETIKALRIGKYRKRRCFFRMERTIADVGSATPFQIHISACDFFQRTRIPQLFQKHIRNHLLSPAFHRSPHTRRSCGCFPTNHSSSGGNRSATSAKSASNCSPT